MVSWRVALCGFLIFHSFAGTSVFADDALREKVTSFFKLMILKLDLHAAACNGYAPSDTGQVRIKLRQYSMDKNGFDYFEPMGEKVNEIRTKLAQAPAVESQRQCVDALRQSLQDYGAMRDVFMHEFPGERAIPPLIDLGSIGLQ